MWIILRKIQGSLVLLKIILTFSKCFFLSEDLSIKPEDIEFTLLTQLVELSLSRDELHKVLSDLDIGPSSDGPSDQPPSSDGLNDQFNGVSLLESHNFNGQIPSDLVLNEEEVRLAPFFRKPWIFSMHFLLWMVNRIIFRIGFISFGHFLL